MRKRSLQILGAALVVGVAAWTLTSPSSVTIDQTQYQQWHRPIDTYARLLFVEHHLPTSLSKLLRLPSLEQRCLDKDEEIYQALHASGYLTNVHIVITNATAHRAQISDRLTKATQVNHAKWEFIIRSNAVVVLTCRPQDVDLCVQAIESN